jgi:hypothetical protein
VNIEKGKHLNAFLFVIKGEANNGKRFDELSGGCKFFCVNECFFILNI